MPPASAGRQLDGDGARNAPGAGEQVADASVAHLLELRRALCKAPQRIW